MPVLYQIAPANCKGSCPCFVAPEPMSNVAFGLKSG